MRINIWVPVEDLKAIDGFCKEARMNRSEFMVTSSLESLRGGTLTTKEIRKLSVLLKELEANHA